MCYQDCREVRAKWRQAVSNGKAVLLFWMNTILDYYVEVLLLVCPWSRPLLIYSTTSKTIYNEYQIMVVNSCAIYAVYSKAHIICNPCPPCSFVCRFYCCARPPGSVANKDARCSFFKWDERSKPLAKPKINNMIPSKQSWRRRKISLLDSQLEVAGWLADACLFGQSDHYLASSLLQPSDLPPGCPPTSIYRILT